MTWQEEMDQKLTGVTRITSHVPYCDLCPWVGHREETLNAAAAALGVHNRSAVHWAHLARRRREEA